MAFYTIVRLFVGICQKGRQQKPFCRYLFAFLSAFVGN
jgi:hypothetical protein